MKHVLLTGAAGGIGAAAAQRLAELGYTVHAGVRGETDRWAGSELIRPVVLDVTDPDSVRRAVRQIAAETDGLHAVVNNAGIIVAGPVELVPAEELHRQFAVNVYGPATVTAAFLPLLRAGHGRVVNVSAPTARVPVPFSGPISASKAALESLSVALRGELKAWGIPVSVVVPGGVDTLIFEKAARNADKTVAALPSELVALYGPDLAAVERAMGKMKLGPVDTVAASIAAAVTARAPKRRYLAGADARAFSALSHLPSRIRERLVLRQLGLPGAR